MHNHTYKLSLLPLISSCLFIGLYLAHPWVERSWSGISYGLYILIEICLFIFGFCSILISLFRFFFRNKKAIHVLDLFNLLLVALSIILPYNGVGIYPQKNIRFTAYYAGTIGSTNINFYQDQTFEIRSSFFTRNYHSGSYRIEEDTLFMHDQSWSPRFIGDTNIIEDGMIIPLHFYSNYSTDSIKMVFMSFEELVSPTYVE